QEAAAARAVEMERQRVAAEAVAAKAKAEKLTANQKRRAKIHREIAAAVGGIVDQTATELLVDALIAGSIPHVSISY
ncbi:MAG: hypothetical protein WCB02_34155, partial [Bradyrhizobium sp.]